MAKYTVGGKEFRTKAELKEHARQYLNKGYKGKFIKDPVVEALVKMHPDYAAMSGDEVCRVKVDSPPRYSTFCFWVVRPGGECDSAGLDLMLKSLSTKPVALQVNSAMKDFRNVMRQLIQPQIDEVRRGWLGQGACDVDHVAPQTFSSLLFRWLETSGLDGSDVAVERVGPATFRLLDRTLEESWINFHREHAVLEAVSKEEHARRTYGQQKTPG